MKISGLQKLTLLDYPGRIAAIVFLPGCNFRCPFCQNSSLVLTPNEEPEISQDEFLRFLKKRAGILEGICVTGGEPTLHADLPELFRRIHEAGYLAKLDTNGTNPDMLEAMLAEGLLDYVAMDIKAGRDNYQRVCGLNCCTSAAISKNLDPTKTFDMSDYPAPTETSDMSDCPAPTETSDMSDCPAPTETSDMSDYPAPTETSDMSDCPAPTETSEFLSDPLLTKINRSVELLKSSGIDYEFRTTVVKGLHSEQDFLDIADWIAGSKAYYLQSFRDCPEVLQQNHSFSDFTEKEMRYFLELVQKKIPAAALRGI